LGVVFGFFINYGVTKSWAGTDTQWRMPTLLQLVPAIVWAIGTLFTPESPRWLLSKNRREEASRVLSRLRNLPAVHPVVIAELAGMELQLLHEMESVAGASQWDLLKETFVPVENRRRFFLIFMATLFSQWSGANAITQYSPTIFGYLGIEGTETTLLATGIYGVVKFTSTLLFALFFVDFVGRRRSLITGIILQMLTLVYVGGYLGGTTNMSTAYISSHPVVSHASTAAIVAIYIHAIGWSIGLFALPYLISSEVFPIRIRSLNMSITMAFHWAFYFACSRAMPSLLVATHRWGAFLFFAIFCVLALVYVYFAMPVSTSPILYFLDLFPLAPFHCINQAKKLTNHSHHHRTLQEDLSSL
jgi:hypothetical protein